MSDREEDTRGIRIGIVDNDPCSLRMIVELDNRSSPALSVVWSATCAQHTLEHCLYDPPERKANVILLDMALNEICGTDVCERIRKRDGSIGIIGMTAYPLDHYRARCIAAGAQGLVGKETLTNAAALAGSIVRAAQGLPCAEQSAFLSAAEAHRQLLDHDEPCSLTPQELRILRLYEAHKSTSEIAENLGIADGTVFAHMHHVLHKFGVQNRNEAIQQCKKMHLL